nr:hypothetical protein [uncultured Dyadobacter sp.]
MSVTQGDSKVSFLAPKPWWFNSSAISHSGHPTGISKPLPSIAPTTPFLPGLRLSYQRSRTYRDRLTLTWCDSTKPIGCKLVQAWEVPTFAIPACDQATFVTSVWLTKMPIQSEIMPGLTFYYPILPIFGEL